jgi:hypothetical protein
MKNKKIIIGLVIGVIILAVIILVAMKKPARAPEATNTTGTPTQNEMLRFANSFNNCQNDAVTIKDPNSDQSVTLEILGLANGKCHYQMRSEGAETGSHGLDCFFPPEVLKSQLLGQLTGNDTGLANEISQYCQMY